MPYNLQQAIKSGSIKRIPEKFTLGKGHVLFFLNKQDFVQTRYLKIYYECRKRGFNVQKFYDLWEDVPDEYLGDDYVQTQEEYKLLVERITERIKNSAKKSWHYYGKEISKDEAIRLLTQNV